MEIQTIADGRPALAPEPAEPRAKLMLGPNPTRKDLMGWLLSHGVPKERGGQAAHQGPPGAVHQGRPSA